MTHSFATKPERLPLPTRLYLDHAATTPLLPAAREAMAAGLAAWANPSSPHAEGRAARAALEDARDRIRSALGWGGELIFTSGATEALAIALKGRCCGGGCVTAVEHDAVLRDSQGCARLPVGPDGRLAIADGAPLCAALEPRAATDFLAVQSANNETGVLQPLSEIDALRHEAWIGRPVILLVDCAQTAGKLPLPPADLIAVSAHKLGGPPGIGALLVRDLGMLAAVGGQERGYRPGTENLPAALGFAAALEAGVPWLDRAGILRERLDRGIAAAGGIVVAGEAPRLPTIASYRMPGMSAAAQLIRFDLAGIAVSMGSACSSGSVRPSHVLAAMGWPEHAAREVVRVSFGPVTSAADVDRFLAEWIAIARGARERAA